MRHKKSIHYFEEEQEKVYFQESEVVQFSLDRFGLNLPLMEGNVVFVHHYLLKFWNRFIKPEGLNIYLLLRMHCYNKDYCWLELQSLCNFTDRSKETIRKYLDLLERYGFIYQFQCENTARNNMQESPITKVRKEFPFLTEELIEQLPVKLQTEHHRFMADLNQKISVSLHVMEKVDYESVFNEALTTGEVVPIRRPYYEEQKINQLKREALQAERNEDDLAFWEQVLEVLKDQFSKPSYNTWFSNTFCIRRENVLWVYAPTRFHKEWLETRYQSNIKNAAQFILKDYIQVKYDSFEQ
ncbi:helix-turn-helix domain-containing protein [Cohnella phaseoli]|uniref:helix-turn-helix domain-containing protein n=1 Tax=Cohnella phaseoli TaxID=456490 RepID=UPI0015F27627|nr:helix-turn-helix domain-containing protein [Cohnella phaseoli]